MRSAPNKHSWVLLHTSFGPSFEEACFISESSHHVRRMELAWFVIYKQSEAFQWQADLEAIVQNCFVNAALDLDFVFST